MEHTTFTPKLAMKTDSISRALFQFARYVLIAMMALLPLVFIPGSAGLIGVSKVFFIAVLILLVVVVVSFGTLRNGAVSFTVPSVLLAWWGIVAAAVVSAVLSEAPRAALTGDALETQTVAFLGLLGLVMGLTLLFQGARRPTVYLFIGMIASAAVVSLWQLVRLVFGTDALSFGVLPENTSTVIGSFNDIAIFVTLVTIVSLISLVQIRLSNLMSWGLGILVAISMLLLVTVNFSMMWVVLSLVSLALLMYGLTRDRFGVTPDVRPPQRISIPAIAIISLVFIVSTVFLIGGSALGTAVSSVTGVNYLEVRPSISATLDVMRGAYQDNAFTGIGPNQFNEAWQKHKDVALNQTLFWNTPFSAASGYIPTWFITTGILGVLAWFVFLAVFIYTTARFLLRSDAIDPFWYFIGSISAASSLFVWVVSLFYVPGTVILAIGALTTGMVVVAQQSAITIPGVRFNFLATARTGFILIAVVMIIVISAIAAGYFTLRHFSALYVYANAISAAQASNDPIATVSERLASAYALHQSDVFAREIAGYQLITINNVMNTPEPSQMQQQQFQGAIQNAIVAANEAIRLRPESAQNWAVLGDIYATLALINIEGASDRAKEAYEKARTFNPNSPYYDFQLGALAYRANNQEDARKYAEAALRLKPNYTDALFLMSQIDITAGDLPRAIAATESLISLESNNPGRYYQLGVLQAASGNREVAVAAFGAAIELNPQFANARYLRALQLVALNQIDAAIKELEMVRDMNPENAAINSVIEKVKAGERNIDALTLGEPVNEPTTVTTENDVTTSDEAPESDLLSPVNGVSTEETGDTESVSDPVAPASPQENPIATSTAQ
jgi:tetratricopeptide (TPR) repeat protein